MPEPGDTDQHTKTGTAPDGLCAVLFDHWLELCRDSPAEDRIPVRAQIDMLTLPTRVLPWFFLHELQDGRYQSVIAGTKLAEGLGYEPTGRFLDEIMPDELYSTRRAVFDTCLAHGKSFFYRATISHPSDRHVAMSRLVMPLRRAADGPLDMLCGAVMFFDRAALGERDQNWIDAGFQGLFHCNAFEQGHWQAWAPSATASAVGQAWAPSATASAVGQPAA